MKKKVLLWVSIGLLLFSLPIFVAGNFGVAIVTKIQGVIFDAPVAGDAGKSVFYNHALAKFDYQDIFVDRGDVAAYDFVVGDFTTDAAWHDLNLSAIVPAGAKRIVFKLTLSDDQANNYLFFRKNGNTNEYACDGFRTGIAGVNWYTTMEVPCDIDRIIEYKFTSTTWAGIDFVVLGWFM